MKKIKTSHILMGFATIIFAGLVLNTYVQSGRTDIIAKNGMHWHPQLSMYVKGEKIEIPQNIGIGPVHNPIHTHDDLPALHLEFGGVVQQKDVMLGKFFDAWGKDMRSFGSSMRMTVNGKESTEYENYMMRDGDKIELRYD